ncbi:MAG TPA: hypothetical protein VGQ10_19775 [Vicinamibacterales bacterium]|jgi:hypothetical protein|nr:hypothetical protein [Vicinamibacterales bacterium]
MSVLFARAVVVPVWMIVVALIAMLAPSEGLRLRDLLLILGLALVASALLALVGSVIGALVPRMRTRHTPVVDVLPAIDVEPRTVPDHGDRIIAHRRTSGVGRDASIVPFTRRRALAVVFSAGAKVWRVEGATATLAGRTRAASDARGTIRIDTD